jgi:hypothetical protein
MKIFITVLSIMLLTASCGKIVSNIKNQIRSSITTPVNRTFGINNYSDSSQTSQDNIPVFSIKEALAEKFGF